MAGTGSEGALGVTAGVYLEIKVPGLFRRKERTVDTMSTQPSRVLEFNPTILMGDGGPLPEFCGPAPDFVPYRLTPEKLRERAAWRRKYLVGRVAYYRLQALRSSRPAAASFYRERASLFSRALRRKTAQPLTGASDLRDEVRSWVVMADCIAAEAHLTAEDYQYA